MPTTYTRLFASATRRHRRQSITLRCESLEARHLLAADPVLSEVMTDNDGYLLDEDGDDPDWIELYNQGDEAVDLDGWFLSDDSDNLDRWRFPSGLLEPGEFLVVFASDKNRAAAGSELHTNFRLDNNGESIYLVEPDGQTIASELLAVPRLPENRSFGIAQSTSTQEFLLPGATGRFLVPSTANGGDGLGTAWTGGAEPFDDSGWLEVQTGVGYLDSLDISSVLAWELEEGTGTVAGDASGNGNAGTLMLPAWNTVDVAPVGSTASLDFDGVDDTVVADDYQGLLGNVERTVSAWIKTSKVPQTSVYAPTIVHWGGLGNGGRFTFRLNENSGNGTVGGLRVEVAGGFVVGQTNLTDGQWHHVAATFDPSDGAGVRSVKLYVDGQLETFSGQGADVAINTTLGDLVTLGYGPAGGLNRYFDGLIDDVRLLDEALTADEVDDLFSGQAGDGDVATSVRAEMQNQNASAFLRLPFQVDAPTQLESLSLNMQYDDGFIAYLNGEEVARRNAPVNAQWNSAATAVHASGLIESIDIPVTPSTLRTGENILAVHGLNVAADDASFLLLPTLSGRSGISGAAELGYFAQPTPGTINGDIDLPVGIVAGTPRHQPATPTENDDIVVTTAIPLSETPQQVTLTYRVMYGPETSLLMVDDGSGHDAAAGDGVYTATIAAAEYAAGEMVRWAVSVEDAGGFVSRNPLWDPVVVDQTAAPEYYGTMIADPSVDSQLPVFYWFLQPGTEAAARTRTGTRASVYFDGEFYDNVFVRVRGGSTASLAKNSYKFDFNEDYHFRFDPRYPRVSEINLNTTFTDKAYVRQNLAYEIYDRVGAPGSLAFPMRVQRNGLFHSVTMFTEQPDEDLLSREGLDPNGALYKVFNAFTSSTSVEKKTRRDEPNTDLADFIAGVNNQTGAALRDYIFDNVDVPAVISYLVGTTLTQNNDQQAKNYYLYRDTEGSGEWMFLPWDLDLTFGLHFMTNDSVLDDEIWADEDVVLGGAGNNVSISPSHPYVGEQEHPGNRSWNRLIDKLYEVPEFRDMYLRRLRTVMDELLQPPETATEELWFERRLDELVAQIGDDATLDFQAWADPWSYGLNLTIGEAVERLKTEYLAVRRTHLYETHSIDALEEPTIDELVPEFGEALYFVPSDDSLGRSWTNLAFDDTGWLSGTGGFGFEDASNDYADLIRTEVRPDTASGGTSVYLRIPFDVSDASQVESLWLRMKYDDAYVAYLNGTEVTRKLFLFGEPAYNSTAFIPRPNRFAVINEDVNLSARTDLLVDGQNVLAIHVMNAATDASDLLVSPILVNGDINPPPNQSVGIPHAQELNPHLDFGQVDFDPVSGNQDEEFIEIVNPNDTAVDISGWRLTGGVQHTFAPGTVVRAGESLYVSPDVRVFRQRATGPAGGQGLLVQGGYAGHLSNQGERVDLISSDGTEINTFTTPDAPSPVQQFLRVSEVHYNPAVAGDVTEFLELTNISTSETLDLTGVRITDGPSEEFSFPAGTMLAPGAYLLVVGDQAAFTARYPEVDTAMIAGQFAGGLSNGGERIKVEDADSNTVVDFEYGDDDPWPVRADGSGASLELRPEALGDANLPQKYYSWRGSTQYGGSPGTAGSEPVGVVISEIRSNSDTLGDAIELYNPTPAAVDISGWYLSDADSNLKKFQIPAGTVLGSGESIVFDESEFNPTPESPAENHFALNGNGDDVWLVTTNLAGQVATFVDDVHFRGTPFGLTLGRTSQSGGRLTMLSRGTLGCENSQELVNDTYIAAINYDPGLPSAAALAIAPDLDSNDLEYLVIMGPVGPGWRVRGGIDFDFPADFAATSEVWILSFNPSDPLNAARLAAFQAHHGLPSDRGPLLVGGYAGSLSNNGDLLQLERPDTTVVADVATAPKVLVDEVLYDDRGSWPAQIPGDAIVRRGSTFFGNNGAHWGHASQAPFATLTGDFNGDAVVNAADIDLLLDAINRQSVNGDYALSGAGEMAGVADVQFLLNEVLGTLAGDANLDGRVDAVDFGVWSSHRFAKCSTWSTADFNGDGVSDARDFNIWNSNKFRGSAAAMAASQRVPRAPLARGVVVVPEAVVAERFKRPEAAAKLLAWRADKVAGIVAARAAIVQASTARAEGWAVKSGRELGQPAGTAEERRDEATRIRALRETVTGATMEEVLDHALASW